MMNAITVSYTHLDVYKRQVHAREAQEHERESLWQALAKKTPDYDQYRSWTSRRIPLVVLERK